MRVAALLPFILWPLYRLARGELRWDYVAFIVVPPVLSYASTATYKLWVGIYPIGVVGLLYDAMRCVQNVGVTTDRVHLCDLRELEIRFFGIRVDGHWTTTHDWLQAHATPPLDILFSIPYAIFLFAYVAVAVFLWLRDFRSLERFAWCFLLLNLAGFATYHIYPAAPPWYFHAYGCRVDLGALPSPGPNLTRVDQWIGFRYFHGLYSRASDVYGAVPSLHVAYPLVIVLESWRWIGALGKVVAISFALTMTIGAVYLDHHWVVDVVLGLAYGVVTVAAMRILLPSRLPEGGVRVAVS